MGPALVEAYEIESSKVRYPVVGVSDAFVDALIASIDKLSWSEDDSMILRELLRRECLSLIRSTEGGVKFVDYLRGFEYHDSSTGDLPFYLKDHKRDIEAAYLRFPSEKTHFLCEYHNKFCLERRKLLERHSEEISDFLIVVHKLH